MVTFTRLSKHILSHVCALATAIFLIPMTASAEAQPAPSPTPIPVAAEVSLEAVLKNVLSNNGMIQESMQDVEIARAQLEQARAAVLPHANALVLAAPIFEEKGNALTSTSNWSKWGPLVKGGIEVAQPLYSFGMLSSYRRAAEKQIDARTGQAEMKRAEVLMTAKEMYYGYQMATDLESLVEDLTSFLGEAITTAEDGLKDKKRKSTVKPHDVYRLKTAFDDLEQKKLYAKAAKQTAEKAIAWVSGVPQVALPKRTLQPEKYQKLALEEYLKIAKAKRPEFMALASGQEARLALRDAKRAQSYPVLFVGGFASLGWSPVREKQNSVFANDPFNSISGGVGLGLKFDLEFGRHAAEAHEQEAEAMKLKATETYAAPGIELQVKKAYWELEQAITGLEVAERRRALGKKWFVSSAMGWSIGITPAKDLMESLEGNGLARKNYIETVYALNMALGHLSQAIGQEVTELKYR
jgi:outer membrane protein